MGPGIQLWVADLTHARTHTDWTHAAFMLDASSPMVMGWQVSTGLRTDLALDALDMGLWARGRAGHDVTGLVHHSDRGVRNRAIRDTERLAEAEAAASVGSKDDSHDNAMAEALNPPFGAECIRNPAMRPISGRKTAADVETTAAEHVDWFNHRRLHGELGPAPPTEHETTHRAAQTNQHYRNTPILTRDQNQPNPHKTRGDSSSTNQSRDAGTRPARAHRRNVCSLHVGMIDAASAVVVGFRLELP